MQAHITMVADGALNLAHRTGIVEPHGQIHIDGLALEVTHRVFVVAAVAYHTVRHSPCGSCPEQQTALSDSLRQPLEHVALIIGLLHVLFQNDHAFVVRLSWHVLGHHMNNTSNFHVAVRSQLGGRVVFVLRQQPFSVLVVSEKHFGKKFTINICHHNVEIY